MQNTQRAVCFHNCIYSMQGLTSYCVSFQRQVLSHSQQNENESIAGMNKRKKQVNKIHAVTKVCRRKRTYVYETESNWTQMALQ